MSKPKVIEITAKWVTGLVGQYSSRYKYMEPSKIDLIEKSAYDKAVEALKQIKDHCLCERSTYGFDCGEKHKHLGKPEGGKRWLQPYDIIEKTLKELGEL